LIPTENASMKTYLVGGAVRDTLLNYPFQEKDWVVVGSSPEEMLTQGYTPVGKDFPVFLHPETHEEYALARTERKVAPGYKGFTFHTEKSITLEEDLERRDLTINAMAMDDNGTIIDPYHGQQDIKAKQLRHVSSAFSEDPVRILRVARFAARYHHLGFTVAPETLELMRTMVANKEAQHLVSERVWQECQKALTEQSPEIFFDLLIECHALHDIIGYSDTATIRAANHYLLSAKTLNQSPLIRYAVWCYALSAETISSVCEKLTTPTAYRELALMTQQQFGVIKNSDDWTATCLSEIFRQTDALRKPNRFEELLQACECIYAANAQEAFVQKQRLLEALNIFNSVNTKELIEQGYQGKELGNALQEQRTKKLEAWLASIADK
jgi:tRNA nucleotidyltransferase (CCA-adding enzyme)